MGNRLGQVKVNDQPINKVGGLGCLEIDESGHVRACLI